MVEITGNTYSVRNQLRALGGRPVKRGKTWVWLLPDEKAEEAKKLVKPSKGGGRRPRSCATCGCGINYGVYCGKCEFGR